MIKLCARCPAIAVANVNGIDVCAACRATFVASQGTPPIVKSYQDDELRKGGMPGGPPSGLSD